MSVAVSCYLMTDVNRGYLQDSRDGPPAGGFTLMQGQPVSSSLTFQRPPPIIPPSPVPGQGYLLSPTGQTPLARTNGPYTNSTHPAVFQATDEFHYANDLERTSAAIAQEWATPPSPYFAKVLDKVLPLLVWAPFLVGLMLKDVALRPGLIAATAGAAASLALTLSLKFFRKRRVWPHLVDPCGLVSFAVLLGVSYYDRDTLHRWLPVAASGAFSAVSLVAVLCRWPFSMHPGKESVLPTISEQMPDSPNLAPDVSVMLENCVWFVALLGICGCTLVPAITDHTHGWNVLNIVFNFVLPPVLLGVALLILLGQRLYALALQKLKPKPRSATNLTLLEARDGSTIQEYNNGKRKEKGGGRAQGPNVISIASLMAKRPRSDQPDILAS